MLSNFEKLRAINFVFFLLLFNLNIIISMESIIIIEGRNIFFEKNHLIIILIINNLYYLVYFV